MTPYFETPNGKLYHGDVLGVLATLPDESVHCCVTSPPYWSLRDYGVPGQIGLEKTPQEYVSKMVEVFREVRRVLRRDGTAWLNIGDTYARDGQKGDNSGWGKHADYLNGEPYPLHEREIPNGLKPKDMVGIPWRVAFALQTDGWYLRSDIIWNKPNPMPESVNDRPTKAHEYIFLLSKSQRYFYDAEAIKEDFADERMGNPNGGGNYAKQAFKLPWQGDQSGLAKGQWNTDKSHTGRNKRTVWTVATHPFPEAHFATFPTKLIEPCILAGCPKGGTVLDPFAGACTTWLVCHQYDRYFIGIELSEDYCRISRKRVEPIMKQRELF